MGPWQHLKSLFGFLERPPAREGLEARLAELQRAVDRLHEEMACWRKDLADRPCDVRIDRVHIDRVNLERLDFNIDDIGVRDLSGSLSIGINYGGRVTRVMAPPPPEGEAGEETPGTPSRPPEEGQTRLKIHFRD